MARAFSPGRGCDASLGRGLRLVSHGPLALADSANGAASYQPGASPQVKWPDEFMSANGATHPPGTM